MSQIPAARKNIYLVGFMGTGKTTIGKELARLMGRKFLDIDQEIERRAQATVAEIFERHGEQAFRQAEQELALELASSSNRIVATGGGTILNPIIFEAFEKSGMLVCLYTQTEDLLDRLQRSEKRPLLRGQTEEEIRRRVDQLLEARQSVYNRVALKVDTTELTPLSAAKRIHEVVSVCHRMQRVREALSDILDQT